jgi:hypothetical protein
MDRTAMLLLTGVGAACIYAGYKLFCGLPAMKSDARVSRAGVLLLNVIPGAILALIGTGLLTAEAHSLVAHRATIQSHHRASEGASWRPGKSGLPPRSA